MSIVLLSCAYVSVSTFVYSPKYGYSVFMLLGESLMTSIALIGRRSGRSKAE